MLLNHKVTVIVPSTVGTDAAPQELIDYHIKNALDTLARVAGGSTAVNAQGAWLDAQGKLVREPVCNVYAYCTEAQFGWLTEAAMRVATEIKETMAQECVGVVIDNVMHFV